MGTTSAKIHNNMQTSKETSSNLIRKYLRYLKLEKGYSPNTLEAYIRDVDKLLIFLADEQKIPQEAKLEDIENFAAAIGDLGIGARSLARILSGVRQFYRFLVLDGYIEADPTELLESPKQPQHLPEVLSTAEVDMLESAIDLSKWGRTSENRAIIENFVFVRITRIRNLHILKLSNLYREEQFVRVMGKGSKERLVPISPRALQELDFWFADRNAMKIKEGEEDYIFLNRRGAHLTRTMI